jgi:hypothetical protein
LDGQEIPITGILKGSKSRMTVCGFVWGRNGQETQEG